MSTLIVYGSKGCLGWEETLEFLDTLQNDPDFSPVIEIRNLKNHREEFEELGAMICPAYVFRGEVIAVGTPDPAFLKDAVDNHAAD